MVRHVAHGGEVRSLAQEKRTWKGVPMKSLSLVRDVRFSDLESVLPDERGWYAQDEQDEVIQEAPAAPSLTSSAVCKRGTDGPQMEWDDDLNDFVQVYHCACVLTPLSMCPYSSMNVSLCYVHVSLLICEYVLAL